MDRRAAAFVMWSLAVGCAGAAPPPPACPRCPVAAAAPTCNAPPAQFATAIAHMMDVHDAFVVPAELAATRTVDVPVMVSGLVDKTHADVGARVDSGGILAALDARPFRLALTDAQVKLNAAQRGNGDPAAARVALDGAELALDASIIR